MLYSGHRYSLQNMIYTIYTEYLICIQKLMTGHGGQLNLLQDIET